MTAFTAPPQERVASSSDAPRSPASRRRRAVLGTLGVLVLIVGLVAAIFGTTSSSTTPLAPDNPQPPGAQAAARILEDQGVSIARATTLPRVVDLAGAGTTVFLTRADRLSGE